MFFLAWGVMQAEEKSNTEYLIIGLSFTSGLLLIVGGINYLKQTITKEKEFNEYEQNIRAQVNAITPNTPGSTSDNKDEAAHLIVEHSTLKKEATSPNHKPILPDIIAHWEYTLEEWKKMTKEESTRRKKEGIWVTLGIAIIGGWAISLSKDATFLTGFMISLAVGAMLSWLKIKFSNDMFAVKARNTIVFTPKALLINNAFKTIRNEQFHLEYVHSLQLNKVWYLEFSLQWQTRGGATNDQFRIYVPPQYENQIDNILECYRALGVKTI